MIEAQTDSSERRKNEYVSLPMHLELDPRGGQFVRDTAEGT